MKLLSFFLCLLGSLFIYFSHVNQSIFKQPLSKFFFYFAIFLLILSLVLWIYSLPKLVAVFMWFATMIVTWSFIPVLPLLKRFIPHEIVKSAKDST